jgi:uncharacterized cofD-like protein
LGPGSLYTSVIPNILVSGIPEAIKQSPALKVYFVNLMWQPGETIRFAASQHVEAIHAHARQKLIDCVVLNSAPIPAALKKKYARANVKPVDNDIENLTKLGLKVVTAELVGDTAAAPRIRHNPQALADVVIDLASRSRAYQVRKKALAAQRKRFR